MPKEQGHYGERAAHSKNAKDKSNSATLRASQSGAHMEPSGVGNMSNHMLRCDSEKDSEKDSGYSEAGSDFVHTDVDDKQSSASEPHRESSRSLNNNNKSANPPGHNMAPYEELTPIYVIKNLVVKQSRPEQLLHGPLAWGGDWHTLTNAKAPTQLLLIQQPAMPAPSTAPPPSSSHTARPGHVKTGGSRSSSNNNNSSQSHSKSSYLPILNSYPRIAPHPRKDTHVSKTTTWVEGVKESGGEGQSQSKRVCTEEEKREAVSTTTHLLKPQQHQKEGRVHSSSQHKGRGGHSSFPSLSHCPVPGHVSSTTQHKSRHCQQSSVSNSVGSPSVSSTQTPSPPSSSDSSSSSSPPSSSPSSSTAHSPYRPAPDSSSARQKRFFNTAGILNQSGLLAITLRTKELLKQNAATEREIAQLRQHTHLLCQVAQANQSRCNDGSDSLEKLFQAMTESASYPNLDSNQLSALSSSSQQSKSRNEEDNEKDNNIRTIKTNGMVQVVSLHTLDDETSPPSPLFAPSPDAEETHNGDPLDALSSSVSLSFPESFNEQGKKTSRQEATDKDLSDLTMLPESSMHNDYFL